MAIFGGARRRFPGRFAPRHDGFAYRFVPHARAVLVTAEERAWLIADFEDRRTVFWIMLFATPVVVVLAGVFAYAVSSSPAVVAATVPLTSIGFPLALVVWSGVGRWRLLRRCPYVDDGPSDAELERRRLRDLSWASIVLSAFSTLIWCAGMVGLRDLHPIWRALAGIVGVFALGVPIREGYLKVKQGRQLRPGDAQS